jgi:hypothetical protein
VVNILTLCSTKWYGSKGASFNLVAAKREIVVVLLKSPCTCVGMVDPIAIQQLPEIPAIHKQHTMQTLGQVRTNGSPEPSWEGKKSYFTHDIVRQITSF